MLPFSSLSLILTFKQKDLRFQFHIAAKKVTKIRILEFNNFAIALFYNLAFPLSSIEWTL